MIVDSKNIMPGAEFSHSWFLKKENCIKSTMNWFFSNKYFHYLNMFCEIKKILLLYYSRLMSKIYKAWRESNAKRYFKYIQHRKYSTHCNIFVKIINNLSFFIFSTQKYFFYNNNWIKTGKTALLLLYFMQRDNTRQCSARIITLKQWKIMLR